MRLNRFYTERINIRIGSSVLLPETDVNHIRKVLRLKKGDKIILFNGEKEFLAELKIVSSEFITVKIIELLNEEDFSQKKVEIVLFQSLLRAGKFDFIVEKVTELGVDVIVPVQTEFSQMKIDVAERKVQRWQKIAIAASKQSERIRVPEIYSPIDFSQIQEMEEGFDHILFFTIPRKNIDTSLASTDLKTFIDRMGTNHKKIAIFIGPEGGFSPNEHKLAASKGFDFVKYGNTALRSETAAIAFVSILKYIYSV